ncbi:hypothetical protein OJ997_23245 [Solirubrobacter phytolaccae]|uniref:DNRLRE domain-containing protein n=1 Tax=Solirubrobacter phytolaccae TaxID=1404360 RepID=A0A9X3SB45_9ACTN|nr:hypothetical protein [Solirubrobacter phytolaccae]MDA0183246.1 hypothetical protein [Solirubrobacter phytolaccae]
MGVLGVLALAAPASQAGTVNIPSNLECNYDDRQTVPYLCEPEQLVVGIDGTDAVWRYWAQLGFDVAGNLPSGATVTSAKLYLYGLSDPGFSASLIVGDPYAPEDEVEFSSAPGWVDFDVTASAQAAAGTASDAVLDVWPALDTPLLPLSWEFVGSASSSTSLRPYLQVDYTL